MAKTNTDILADVSTISNKAALSGGKHFTQFNHRINCFRLPLCVNNH